MPCIVRVIMTNVNVKKIAASYEPYKRLLPVVFLPFTRDATSAYKLNTSYVLHVPSCYGGHHHHCIMGVPVDVQCADS